MLSTALIVLGAVTAVVGLLDILLDDKQKRYVDLMTLAVWSKLHDARRAVIDNWLVRPRVMVPVFIIGFMVTLYLFAPVFERQFGPLKLNTLAGAVGALLGGTSALGLISLGSGSKSKGDLALLFITVGVEAFFSTIIFLTTFGLFVAVEAINADVFGFNLLPDSDTVLTGFKAFVAVAVALWLASLAPLIFVIVVSTIIYTLEFAVRRLAEYPKGILITVGMIATGVGGFLKLLA